MRKIGGDGCEKPMLTLAINDKAVSHNITRPFIKMGDLFVLNNIE